MKSIYLLVSFTMSFSSLLSAQVPHSFSYQAVVRSSNGEPLAYQLTNFRISLLLGSDVGPVSYQETHLQTTNFFGLVNLEVGNGAAVGGNMDTLSWGSKSYYIKIEADTAGGSNFVALGTTQLLAVPYALHASTSTRAEASPLIRNSDGETMVTTELTPGDDNIRFFTGGQERLRLTGTRLETVNNSGNILFGDKSGEAITSGSGNIFIGDSAGARNTEGSINTFLGTWSGTSNTTGNSNTFMGFLSGSKNTTGNFNTFIGMLSGRWNTTGSVNTFVGMFSGRYNTTGHDNTFMGYESGHLNTEGTHNTFAGTLSGHDNITGSRNTCIGEASGYVNQYGNDNTFIGNASGQYTYGSNNVFIGAYAGMDESGSGKLYIANSQTSEPLIYGDFAERKLKFWADSVEASGEIRSGKRFSVNGNPGINDTLNHITAFDYANDKLRYRTTVYTGGIVTWLSEESPWVDSVVNPIVPCGIITMVGEFNGWGGDTATMPDHMMTRDPNDPNFWTTIFELTVEDDHSDPPDNIVESKFRENWNWERNWGSTEFPAGTGYPGYGNNIPVLLNPAYDTTIYYVTFTCSTGYYTFEDISGDAPVSNPVGPNHQEDANHREAIQTKHD
ncbi:MAG: hypothetical protein PHD25_05070 [Bacteroidales bacterium]|nr:hypothetical protein [Bacteroidales bacterium]